MTILETSKTNLLGVGVVNDGYNNTRMPGWRDESVGYHIDDGKIFQSVRIRRTEHDDVGYSSFHTRGTFSLECSNSKISVLGISQPRY